jgi:hypothetical protein
MPRVKINSDDVTAAIAAVEKWRALRTTENGTAAALALAKIPGTWVVVEGTRYCAMKKAESGYMLCEQVEDHEAIPF